MGKSEHSFRSNLHRDSLAANTIPFLVSSRGTHKCKLAEQVDRNDLTSTM
ncbi:hypothetical protein RISK_002290 [Rhodopirellula islandica]|uniref:Uncharacterized protein n=1 Tax=Rhodopirellula islandica TaxID=595434 RepID=A0A0J1BGI5_RHOIS|nr:hypothetical protein RISK_002290 [Rhodopirellula islandica]